MTRVPLYRSIIPLVGDGDGIRRSLPRPSRQVRLPLSSDRRPGAALSPAPPVGARLPPHPGARCHGRGRDGSGGKTTTKDLLAAALAPEGCTKSLRNWNRPAGRRAFHAARPAPSAVPHPGGGDRRLQHPDRDSLPLLVPDMAVVTTIGTDHVSLYGSIDGIAAEKGKLAAALSQDGIAVLNADDPWVAAMAGRCRGRIVTFGCEAGAEFRALDVRADWPDRLSFTLAHGELRLPVRTQLVGSVWLVAVLASLAAAITLGVPGRGDRPDRTSAAATAADGAFGPSRRRDLRLRSHEGPALAFRDDARLLRRARAERKILIIGTISDYKQKSARAYSGLATQALEVADLVVFAGAHAHRSRKAIRHPRANYLHAFLDREQTARFLAAELRPGDLVLIKGSSKVDDLLPLARGGPRPTLLAGNPAPRPTATETRPLLVVGLGNARPSSTTRRTISADGRSRCWLPRRRPPSKRYSAARSPAFPAGRPCSSSSTRS